MSTTASWKVATPAASGVLPDPPDLSKETDPAPVRGADASRRSPPPSSRPRRSSWAEGWPGRAACCSSRSARPWTATSAWSGGRGCCPPPCGMRRLPGRRPAGLGGARPWAGAIILTVAPNVALDITYRVDQLTAGLSHRVRSVEERAGGKGSTSRELSMRWATTPSSSGWSAARPPAPSPPISPAAGSATSSSWSRARRDGPSRWSTPATRRRRCSTSRVLASPPRAGATWKPGSPPGFRRRRRWSCPEACLPASATTPVPGSCAWPPRTGWWSWSTPSVRRSSRPPPPGPTS